MNADSSRPVQKRRLTSRAGSCSAVAPFPSWLLALYSGTASDWEVAAAHYSLVSKSNREVPAGARSTVQTVSCAAQRRHSIRTGLAGLPRWLLVTNGVCVHPGDFGGSESAASPRGRGGAATEKQEQAQGVRPSDAYRGHSALGTAARGTARQAARAPRAARP